MYSLAEELEILTQSLRRYQTSGGKVEIAPEFHFAGQRMVAILLPDTQFVDGTLVPLVAQDSSESH